LVYYSFLGADWWLLLCRLCQNFFLNVNLFAMPTSRYLANHLSSKVRCINPSIKTMIRSLRVDTPTTALTRCKKCFSSALPGRYCWLVSLSRCCSELLTHREFGFAIYPRLMLRDARA
jgi:hypothetical protein